MSQGKTSGNQQTHRHYEPGLLSQRDGMAKVERKNDRIRLRRGVRSGTRCGDVSSSTPTTVRRPVGDPRTVRGGRLRPRRNPQHHGRRFLAPTGSARPKRTVRGRNDGVGLQLDEDDVSVRVTDVLAVVLLGRQPVVPARISTSRCMSPL